jgi:iron complex transport system ATP-binding protein
MNTDYIITVDNVCFGYPRASCLALQDLSLGVSRNSVTALLGPNGSGKTTLMSLLLGWLKPQKGSISIEKHNPSLAPRSVMSKLIGLVPQEETFPLGLTVLQYVLLGRAPYLGLLGHPGAKDWLMAQEAIATVGLERFKDRTTASLSGGEKQLATIARAIAQEPKILLMDEPTAHLDLANKQRVLHTIISLAKRDVTVMLSTHDPNVAADIADRSVLLRNGEQVAVGATYDVLTEDNLSSTYNVEVAVVDVLGRPVVLLHSGKPQPVAGKSGTS